MRNQNIDVQLLTAKETAKLLNTSVSTLASWRVQRNTKLQWIKIGKLVRYRLTDVIAFIDSQTYESTF